MKIYFDNAATTRLSDEVFEAMKPYFLEKFGNPSSIQAFGRETRSAIEKVRKSVARHLNASTGEIFFTSGGTESNNMALKCAVLDAGVKRIISSKAEHHAITHTLDFLEQKMNVRVDFVSHFANGHVDLESLENFLKNSTEPTLVSLMHANNEIGNLLNLSAVSALCREYGALFHSDTVQTVGHYPIDVQAIPVDFLSASAHKHHGPKGVGFIYINSAVSVGPLLHGGGQERNMRAGTENLTGIIGLGAALDLSIAEMEAQTEYIQKLKTRMIHRLREAIPGVSFNGDAEGDSLYTVLNVSFPPGEQNELLMFNLDIEGIAASGGSACSSGTEQESHVLAAIGANPKRKAIRFSFSKYNTPDEVDYTVQKLKELVVGQVLG